MPSFYEFFAGGGMARAGLGCAWECLFANDIDEKKAASYKDNWTDKVLKRKDVGLLTTEDLPGTPDLIWASFPCQDLSLAGNGAGLDGERSGSFWPFWKLVKGLRSENRKPNVIVLENVCGALTSHNGEDFRSLISAVRREGYRAGALVVDAALFVPQSRPRLFIIGISNHLPIDSSLLLAQPQGPFHTAAIKTAFENLPEADRKAWLWWRLPIPSPRTSTFADKVEEDAPWHTEEQTQALLNLMLPLHKAKVATAMRMKKKVIGTIYKRTRPDSAGVKAQRAEVRFDDLAGCLRTPGGGSSRQSILVVEGSKVRSRLLTPREAARLMGLEDSYILPENYNDAYHLMGDGLAVPVVSHIANNLLGPFMQNLRLLAEDAA
jgi:DNA (cytosine-5)-methyltransferase 1